MLHAHILPFFLWLVYLAFRATWRIRVYEHPEFKAWRKQNKQVVFAHWHGDIPEILYLLKPYKAAPIISHSKDGALVDGVARLLGAKTTRGSSHRGGVGALKAMLRLARSGHNPALAVDGPKGPRHKVKPGILELSRTLKAPIVPLVAASSRSWIFRKAWDQTCWPKPFARIEVIFDKPLFLMQADSDPHDPRLLKQVEDALSAAGQQACIHLRSEDLDASL